MTLALYDLDNTLLNGDSDYSWGRFLIARNLVDEADYERRNQGFYDDYKAGTLDIHAYVAFQTAILNQHARETLQAWRKEYIEEMVKPMMLPKGRELIKYHRGLGHRPVIITATNNFVTTPIARELGIDDLLATDLEEDASGRFTGRAAGTPCFHEGKVTRLNQWMQDEGESLAGSWFYSDSHNDLPLLKMVDNPVAVDADEKLTAHAKAAHWPIISLREEG